MNLFEQQDDATEPETGKAKTRPLADLLRPQAIEEVIGQDKLLAGDGPLGSMLAAGKISSLILWGPTGVGKTTIGRLLAMKTDFHFEQISAIFSGVADLKRAFQAARGRHRRGQGTLLFIDEIHRFNKTQLDALLPVMEDGTVTVCGATTENPSFSVNRAVLSRCQVMVLERLDERALSAIIARTERVLDSPLPLDDEAKELLCAMADGDGRALLNLVESTLTWPRDHIYSAKEVANRLTQRAAQYDRASDGHYSIASAIQKSIRGSDPEAAIYWVHRALEGGEDPRFILRRLTMIAWEDVGLADPEASRICLSAWDTFEKLGSPEGDLAVSQAAIYLALAPKSNAGYLAHKAARADAKISGSAPPPMHIVNAPTAMMKNLGYGEGYQYDHDAPDGFSGQVFFPDGMARPQHYLPVERGFERELSKRVRYFEKLRKVRNSEGG
ncbi:MAG: replication-associated recombination protein A [Sulfitobacter sp.]|jgi:putative ATPase|uniref:Replication-associated recombination protein A n=1 Tax=Sulfitobacter delicatus TaxID=218672 RepID=A0A1G7H5W0_9RHOB|nr:MULTISPECIES: replication-associated recombination protein A [Sulfitobacter]MAP15702.1 replication-associated recombination protein A [Sulfitobacter sp.]AYE87255.1 AAA family ATPase [Sulfitobacter sp. D7]MBM05294.1 replication-associated recombination protein A [Sulfitobacter sp.]MCZ4368064.1 replication-associated recombination protein A [Sulfitobacter dubius]UWR29598.1 replication-associated recombination protein A [Sulfitobacter sp. W002]|tara:strand:+ start:5522 stop:6850 length:1329 start_codon:yes stop_codon:yes gene_type:complete